MNCLNPISIIFLKSYTFLVEGFSWTLMQWKQTKTPSWSAMGETVPWHWILSMLSEKTKSIKETVFVVMQVGISINCWKPWEVDNSGADVSSGFGLRTGNLQ